MYSTVLYCTVLYCTVLYCDCTVMHCTALYSEQPTWSIGVSLCTVSSNMLAVYVLFLNTGGRSFTSLHIFILFKYFPFKSYFFPYYLFLKIWERSAKKNPRKNRLTGIKAKKTGEKGQDMFFIISERGESLK